ncbi:hypothetical protein BDF14DRAFT_1789855 [Spinellus fusiger]|nr:hypothetical protein BDF14DRAFT_1789855 [Spinellus fusiger]
MASTRHYITPTSSGRIVTLQSGGLNERFSQLRQQPKKQGLAQQTTMPNSVFHRLRGSGSSSTAPPPPPGASHRNRHGTSNGIQSRLGKSIGGGIRKRSATTNQGLSPMTGVERTYPRGNGKLAVKQRSPYGVRRGQTAVATHNSHRGSTRGGARGRGGGRGGLNGRGGSVGAHVKPKKSSAEDLDKALDAYMMKDPKTAQQKLDEELNSYMDEAGDILMEL